MKKQNKVLTAGLWYTVSNFALKAMGFITTPIFARMLTKTQFGDYSNFITWLNILIVISGFCLYTSVNRARLDFPNNLNQYLSSITLLGTFITCVLYIIVICKMKFFENLFSMNSFYIHCIFVYLLVQQALEVFQVKQRVTYKYKTSVALSFLTTILTTVVSIILVILMEDKFCGRVLGYVIPSVVICLGVYVVIIMQGKSIKWEYCKYALAFSWPYVPHMLANTILSSSDRVMIKSICGSEQNAIYTIACSCATIASILWTSMNNAVSPWVFDKLEEKNTEAIRKITVPYLLLFTLPVQLCLLVAPEILLILGGNKYAEAKYVIVPLMTSVILQFAYSLYVNIEQYAKKTWCIATGTVIAALLNIGLNIALIPKYGYKAAAYTTLTGYFVLFLIHYIFVRVLGYKHVYDDKFVFLTIVIALIVQIPTLILYDHAAIRYTVFVIELFIVSIIAYVKRKKIIEVLKQTRI